MGCSGANAEVRVTARSGQRSLLRYPKETPPGAASTQAALNQSAFGIISSMEATIVNPDISKVNTRASKVDCRGGMPLWTSGKQFRVNLVSVLGGYFGRSCAWCGAILARCEQYTVGRQQASAMPSSACVNSVTSTEKTGS